MSVPFSTGHHQRFWPIVRTRRRVRRTLHPPRSGRPHLAKRLRPYSPRTFRADPATAHCCLQPLANDLPAPQSPTPAGVPAPGRGCPSSPGPRAWRGRSRAWCHSGPGPGRRWGVFRIGQHARVVGLRRDRVNASALTGALRRLAGQPARVVDGVDHLAGPQAGASPRAPGGASMRNTMPRQLPPVSSANTSPGHWACPGSRGSTSSAPGASHAPWPGAARVCKVRPPDQRAIAIQPEVVGGGPTAPAFGPAWRRGRGGAGRGVGVGRGVYARWGDRARVKEGQQRKNTGITCGAFAIIGAPVGTCWPAPPV